MADPISSTLVTLAPAIVSGIGMAAGAQGSHEAAAADQERMSRVNQGLDQQNARLLAGPAGPPGYTQNVTGYGPADASGQYTTIQPPATPQFADGMPAAAAAQAPGAVADSPEMRARYQQYLAQFGGVPGGVVNSPGVPQAMTPMAAPNVFGVPVFFDDGSGQRG